MNTLEDLLEIAASRLAVNDLYIVELEGLLVTLCENLSYSYEGLCESSPLPPELQDWWAEYQDRT